MMQKYEYILVEGRPDKHHGTLYFVNGERFPQQLRKSWEALRGLELHNLLNEMEEEGWELIGVPQISKGVLVDLVFKRPRQQDGSS